MHTLERFSPFDELERMLENFRMRPLAGATAGFGGDLRLDVSEDDRCYFVKAEMPGVSKDDIKISVEGNQVSIAAEVKKAQNEEGKNMLCAECFYGQVYRSFTLGQPVDDEKADAKYENGVLMLTLPKKTVGAAHKLTVH
jgi:HSP20 family protein